MSFEKFMNKVLKQADGEEAVAPHALVRPYLHGDRLGRRETHQFVAARSPGTESTRRLADRVAALPRTLESIDQPIWEAVLGLLEEPLRAWDVPGGRMVIALDAYGFLLRWNRTQAASASWIPAWVEFAGDVAGVAFPFRRSFHFAPLQKAILARFEQASHDSHSDWEDRIVNASVQAFRVLRRTGVLRCLSRCIREAVGIDQKALRLAMTARDPSGVGLVTNTAYALAADQRETLSLLHRETPNLLPLVFHAHEAGALRTVDCAAIGGVRLTFVREGIPNRVWRLLATSSTRPVRDALRVIKDENAWESILTYCRYLGCWEADRLVPADVLKAIFSSQEPDENGRVHVRFLPDGPAEAPFVALGLQEYWKRAAAERARFIANEFLLVMGWVWDASPTLDGRQRRAGWPRLLRLARACAEGQKAKALFAETRCPSPLERFERDGYTAVALTTAYALWEEGQALRHCIATYADKCIDGRMLAYSILDLAGRRIATAAFDVRGSGGVWVLGAVRGFANRPVSGEVEDFAYWLLFEVNNEAAKLRMFGKPERPKRVYAREYLLPPPGDPMRGAAEAIEEWLEELASEDANTDEVTAKEEKHHV